MQNNPQRFFLSVCHIVLFLASCTNVTKVNKTLPDQQPVGNTLSAARSIDGKFISWKEHIIDDTKLSKVGISGGDGLVMADLDLDGYMDVISVHESDTEYDGVARGHIRIAYGSANPNRWELVTLAQGQEAGAAEDVAVADVNNDGYPDVIAACELAHLIYFENPKKNIRTAHWPRLIPEITKNRGSFIRVFIADLDNDKQVEILAANKGSQSGRSKGALPKPISYFKINGDPLLNEPWSETQLINVFVPINSVPVDIDNDGDLDIIAGSRGEKRIVLLENSGGDLLRFESHNINVTGNTKPALSGFNMEFSDINNDSRIDIILAEGSSDICWIEQPSDWNKEWKFHRIGSNSPDDMCGIVAADINGDGRIDILTGGYSRGSRDKEDKADVNNSLGRLAWYEQPKDLSGPWVRHDISRRKRGMFDKFIAIDMDGDGDIDFVSTRGNSLPYDGVFWLEQVRTDKARQSFVKARKVDSPEMPLPKTNE